MQRLDKAENSKYYIRSTALENTLITIVKILDKRKYRIV